MGTSFRSERLLGGLDGLLAKRPWARRLGLRARITLAFAVGGLGLSTLMSATTWVLTRETAVNQRESSAASVMYSNARSVRRQLAANVEPDALLPTLSAVGAAKPLLATGGAWYAASIEFSHDQLPPALVDAVLQGQPASMRYELNGDVHLALGLPIPAVGAHYFEIVPLQDLERTLQALAVSLIGASVLTTLAGAALGSWASRRLLQPLSGMTEAAAALARGGLDTRLGASEDPDLAPITTSFNEMASVLQERIERDARFASDVSHELRSPLMTLAASIEVLENQRDELPERARTVLDLMAADLARFGQLVEDLLEISRFDAGVVRLELEEVHLAELVMHAVSELGDREIPVELGADLAGAVVKADKRRIVRVIANLLDNAAKYGDGATSVSLHRVDGGVQLAVEDLGPGVLEEDRAVIFDRFSRGTSARRRGASDGVGLGLALVAEHVNLHGGRIWVEDRADGKEGARFVVQLPIAEEPQ